MPDRHKRYLTEEQKVARNVARIRGPRAAIQAKIAEARRRDPAMELEVAMPFKDYGRLFDDSNYDNASIDGVPVVFEAGPAKVRER